MSKKLVSLVLVLALTSMASAIQWVGVGTGGASGAWEDTANWDAARLPVLTDTATVVQRMDGTGSNVTISSTVVANKIQMKFAGGQNMKLAIIGTGVLNSEGSHEQGKGLSSEVYIGADAILNACMKVTNSLATYKLNSAANGADVINVYGTLAVKNVGTLTTVDSDLSISGGTGTGTGTVNIYDGGLVDVDKYLIASARGKIKIWDGGVMRIKGHKVAQTSADITAGRIVDSSGGAGVHTYYVASEGFTYVEVPEPATIALLGLGSLLLYRKKH